MAKNKQRIVQNRAHKLARNKARESRSRKAAAGATPGFEQRYGVSRAAIRAAPLRRVLVSGSLFREGIGDVVVSRELEGGLLAVAVVLLDVFCLGVKDAFLRIMTPIALDALIARAREVQPLEDAATEYARKLVDGAIAYARALDLEPHRDFADASVLLEGIDPAACDAVFTYGKDGKPFYVNGPSHNEQKARSIVAHLAARLGPDGFHYLVSLDGAPQFADD